MEATTVIADGAGLNRRERRKLAVRESIIEAALGLFDQYGLAETTVAEICELADVAEKTFFNHFPTRQHLIRDIAERALGDLFGHIEDARKHRGSCRERLEVFFRAVAVASQEAGPMRRELLTEMIHIGHDNGGESDRARRLHDAFAGFVHDGQRDGVISSKHHLDTATELITGAFYSLMFNWVHLDDYPLKRQALRMASIVADALSAQQVEG
jgi:AcrR family transcriptional regulator